MYQKEKKSLNHMPPFVFCSSDGAEAGVQITLFARKIYFLLRSSCFSLFSVLLLCFLLSSLPALFRAF